MLLGDRLAQLQYTERAAAHCPDPLASGAGLELAQSLCREQKASGNQRFHSRGTLCQQGQTHTGQRLAASACLRTLVSERALAGLGAARCDEACLSGDEKGRSYNR